MNVVVFGGSGMIGEAVVLQALDSPRVETVLSVGRTRLDLQHPKLRQVVHRDFNDFESICGELRGLDACFWCLGIASAGMDEATYTRITYDFTMAAATVLREENPQMRFCFISGAGTATDSRMMWARVKGRTEDALKELGFESLYLFRPGFIRPVRGRRTPGALLGTAAAAPFAIVRLFGGATTNAEIGSAMIAAASGMAEKQVLTTSDINRLAASV